MGVQQNTPVVSFLYLVYNYTTWSFQLREPFYFSLPPSAYANFIALRAEGFPCVIYRHRHPGDRLRDQRTPFIKLSILIFIQFDSKISVGLFEVNSCKLHFGRFAQYTHYN